MIEHLPHIRKKKRDPVTDFWYTLKWGVVVFFVLLVLIPNAFDLIGLTPPEMP